MLVYCRITPSTKFAGTYLNTLVGRGTMEVKTVSAERSSNKGKNKDTKKNL